MKILTCKYIKDFGHEYYISFLKGRKYSFFQATLGWNDYSGWPYVQVSSGQGRLLSILFWIYRFSFDLDLFANNWPHKYDE